MAAISEGAEAEAEAEPSEAESAEEASWFAKFCERAAVRRVFHWTLFSAIFGLFPIIASEFKSLTAAQGFDISNALSTGELLIVSAVLSAGALGEILTSPTRGKSYTTSIAVFCCIMCFFANTVAYMEVGYVSTSDIATLSIVLFFPTVISGAACVAKAEGQ